MEGAEGEGGLEVDTGELAERASQLCMGSANEASMRSELEDISTQLAIASESSLGSSLTSLRSLASDLSRLLHHLFNPWCKVLATRAITTLADVVPESQSPIVDADAVPALVRQLSEVDYIDLAEQSLEALSKLGGMHGESLVLHGALDAALRCVEFFSPGQQRVAALAASNMTTVLSRRGVFSAAASAERIHRLLDMEDGTLVACGVHILHSITQNADSSLLSSLLGSDGVLYKLVALADRPDLSDSDGDMHDLVLELLHIAASGSSSLARSVLSAGAVPMLSALAERKKAMRIEALRAASAIVSNACARSSSDLIDNKSRLVPEDEPWRAQAWDLLDGSAARKRKLNARTRQSSVTGRFSRRKKRRRPEANLQKLRQCHNERQQQRYENEEGEVDAAESEEHELTLRLEDCGDLHRLMKVALQCAAEEGEEIGVQLANTVLSELERDNSTARLPMKGIIEDPAVTNCVFRVLSLNCEDGDNVRMLTEILTFVGKASRSADGVSQHMAKSGLSSTVLQMCSKRGTVGECASEAAKIAQLERAESLRDLARDELMAIARLVASGDKQAARELARRMGSGEVSPSELLSANASEALRSFLLDERGGKRAEAKLRALCNGSSLTALAKSLAEMFALLRTSHTEHRRALPGDADDKLWMCMRAMPYAESDDEELYHSISPDVSSEHQMLQGGNLDGYMSSEHDCVAKRPLPLPRNHERSMCCFAREIVSSLRAGQGIALPAPARAAVGGERGQKIVELMLRIDEHARMVPGLDPPDWNSMSCSAVAERVDAEQDAAKDEGRSVFLPPLPIPSLKRRSGAPTSWIMRLAHTAPFLIERSQRENLIARGSIDRGREVLTVLRGNERANADAVLAGKGRVDVQYQNEAGTGEGPTAEFFSCLSKSLFNETMWRCGEVPLFPKPFAELSSEEQCSSGHAMRTLGLAVGRAVLDGRLLDLPLSECFFRRFVLQQPVSLKHLAEIEPEVSNSLSLMLRRKTRSEHLPGGLAHSMMNSSSTGDRALDTEGEGKGGEKKEGSGSAAMIGWNKDDDEVTWSSAGRYVRDYVDRIIGSGVEQHVRAFRGGLAAVMAEPRVLEAFNETEVRSLVLGDSVLGHSKGWTQMSLANSIRASHGYSKASAPFRTLLEVMCQLMGDEERKALLEFWIGVGRLPPGGFDSLSPPLQVVHKPPSDSAAPDADLPSALTCQRQLKLPPYSSAEVMHKQLGYAISEGGKSFHLS